MGDTNGTNTGRTGGIDSEVLRCLTDRLLTDAGLTVAEARLYRATLQQPGGDLTALAWHVDTPPAVVEKLLRRLVRRGFITTHDGAPIRYQPVDPTVALHLTVTRREHTLLDQFAILGRVSATLPAVARAAVADRRRRDQPNLPITPLGAGETARVRAELAFTADTVRRIVTHPDDVTDIAVGAAERRTICRRDLLDDDAAYGRVCRTARDGDDIRLLPDPAVDLLVAGDDGAVVGRGDTAVLIHPSPLLELAQRQFDLLWDRAVPLSGAANTDAIWTVADDDRALLGLLAAGFKDQAIARRLGIGVRTVVRRIGALSRALDAETRFQLGVQAKTRGLI